MMNNVCINVFAHENKLAFRIYVSGQSFKDSMDLLLLKNDNNSHYSTSKILTDLCFTKQKMETKNGFVEVVYSVLVEKFC